MSDRVVIQIYPKLELEDQKEGLFSSFLDCPNIVLLGDPGAGKSHLFDHFSNLANTKKINARSLLVRKTLDDTSVLFIDALDESRILGSAENSVDKITEKLYELKPEKVRISCRLADWRGKNDLTILSDYFNDHGGYKVLLLKTLTANEQKNILKENGESNPEDFIEQAAKLGLEELLGNPLNLKLLSQSVKKNCEWPKSRQELLQISAEILLSEENEQHQYSQTAYPPLELIDAAGAICAASLTSDVSGISLQMQSVDAEFPSYRTVPYPDKEKIRAVLCRRAFVGIEEEKVSYIHRTIAEYLAARWLEKKIKEGLPFGRIQSLIGVNGYPTPELRGLYAWLPVFLPDEAGVFIKNDPLGVLIYGDSQSLTRTNKKLLIDSLIKAVKDFPLSDLYELPMSKLATLSEPGADMLETYRQLISNNLNNSHALILILRILSAGLPMPDLQADVMKIFDQTSDKGEDYALRREVINSLLNMGDLIKDYVAEEIYKKS